MNDKNDKEEKSFRDLTIKEWREFWKRLDKFVFLSLISIVIGTFLFWFFLGFENGRGFLFVSVVMMLLGLVAGIIMKRFPVFRGGTDVYYGKTAREMGIYAFSVGLLFFIS